MRLDELLAVVGEEPIFETGVLLAGDVDQKDVRRQLSRWVEQGKVIQLRRGLYALARPYGSISPHPFAVATVLVRGSAVSLQSALSYHGVIPEHVPVTTCVTVGRTGLRKTPLGSFDYRHIGKSLWRGFRRTEVAPGQYALIALAEKALLDLVHLTPGGDDPGFLRELRISGESLDPDTALEIAERSGYPKLIRAAKRIAEILQAYRAGWERL